MCYSRRNFYASDSRRQIEGVKMDAESLKEVDSAIGTGGVIVMDEDTDLVKVLERIAHFYHHESCGQCTPCREGTGWLEKILKRIIAGKGLTSDLDLLITVANQIEGNTIRALGELAAWPVKFMVERFRDYFLVNNEAKNELTCCKQSPLNQESASASDVKYLISFN